MSVPTNRSVYHKSQLCNYLSLLIYKRPNFLEAGRSGEVAHKTVQGKYSRTVARQQYFPFTVKFTGVRVSETDRAVSWVRYSLIDSYVNIIITSNKTKVRILSYI